MMQDLNNDAEYTVWLDSLRLFKATGAAIQAIDWEPGLVDRLRFSATWWSDRASREGDEIDAQGTTKNTEQRQWQR